MVICLERGADLHTAQMMPLPFTVSCFSKIQTGVTFLVSADLGSPGKRAVKRVCVCVCLYVCLSERKTAGAVDTKVGRVMVHGRSCTCVDPEVKRSVDG